MVKEREKCPPNSSNLYVVDRRKQLWHRSCISKGQKLVPGRVGEKKTISDITMVNDASKGHSV